MILAGVRILLEAISIELEEWCTSDIELQTHTGEKSLCKEDARPKLLLVYI
jgi:hypothetical protein